MDYIKVKKSPGIESRNKRKGPIKRVLRSHINIAVRYVHTHDVFLFCFFANLLARATLIIFSDSGCPDCDAEGLGGSSDDDDALKL